jgi:hypothetical protein
MTSYITTYKQRFTAAVQALVGKKPPASHVDHWLGDNAKEALHWPLQDWVNANTKGTMGHIQGIAILDAAHHVAENPDEGENHEPAPDDRLEPFPMHLEMIRSTMFQAWLTTSVKLAVLVASVEERISFIETLQLELDAVQFFHHAKRLDVKVDLHEFVMNLQEYPLVINLNAINADEE